jgi:hypothetical protein
VRNPLAEAAASGNASAASTMAPACGLDGAGLSDSGTRSAGHPILLPESSSVEWDAWAGGGNAAAIRMETRTAAVAAALLPARAIGRSIVGEVAARYEVVRECGSPRMQLRTNLEELAVNNSFEKSLIFIGGGKINERLFVFAPSLCCSRLSGLTDRRGY